MKRTPGNTKVKLNYNLTGVNKQVEFVIFRGSATGTGETLYTNLYTSFGDFFLLTKVESQLIMISKYLISPAVLNNYMLAEFLLLHCFLELTHNFIVNIKTNNVKQNLPLLIYSSLVRSFIAAVFT